MRDERQLPIELVDMLREAGVFAMTVPRSRGGPEMSSIDQNVVIETLSRADASVGWCVMIGCDSGIYSSYLRPEVAKEMYPRLTMITGGWIHPAGRAERVPGGFVMSGRWTFGSGVTHADWVIGGCTVVDGDGEPILKDGRPEWRILMAPGDEYEVIDTWRSTGLAGSGSHDYAVEGLFVPEERSFSFFDSPFEEGTLYHRPDAFLRKMPGVPLGAARAAIDFVTKRAMGSTGGVRGAREWALEVAIARAETELGAARAYVYSSLAELQEHLDKGDPVPVAVRAAAALARRNAFRKCRELVAGLYDAVGAEAIYSTATPLDRLLRDLTTMSQHVVAQDVVLSWVGELVVGGQSDAPFL